MRIFANKAFMRFATKDGLGDGVLCEAIRDAERGLIAADLGGGVIKQRIAKNETDNIGKDELAALKKLASELLALDDNAIARVVEYGTLTEVICDEKAIP